MQPISQSSSPLRHLDSSLSSFSNPLMTMIKTQQLFIAAIVTVTLFSFLVGQPILIAGFGLLTGCVVIYSTFFTHSKSVHNTTPSYISAPWHQRSRPSFFHSHQVRHQSYPSFVSPAVRREYSYYKPPVGGGHFSSSPYTEENRRNRKPKVGRGHF